MARKMGYTPQTDMQNNVFWQIWKNKPTCSKFIGWYTVIRGYNVLRLASGI